MYLTLECVVFFLFVFLNDFMTDFETAWICKIGRGGLIYHNSHYPPLIIIANLIATCSASIYILSLNFVGTF